MENEKIYVIALESGLTCFFDQQEEEKSVSY